MPYKLSATLSNHSSDVRAVASPTDNLVLSASRDSTAISWLRESPSSFSPSSILRAGSRYINAVGYLPPTADAPQGYAVTGGQDMVINIFALDSSNKEDPDYSLIGHTDNVCVIHVRPVWTAKVWKDFKLQYDLKGHEQSVWAVLAIDDSQFLTASADRTIKFWIQHKVMQTYEGHRDAVRGLALVPDIGFASCSNDSEIRVWTMSGDVVYTLSGHTSFVYSLSVLPSGDVVSAGEDRSVRVWRDGECAQVIVHPAISVWAVSTMPNGDIVSGCSDGVVRVFSNSEERWASEVDLKTFEDQVSSQALSSQQVGDVKKADLPGPEVLATPGKKAGEVKMVRTGDAVEAHQWDATTSTWQKIGEVVDAVGSGRKQLYNGKEYDYEGVPPLKLPYNISGERKSRLINLSSLMTPAENPYAAAQRFLEQNEISMNYIDEIVKFIEKNTAGVNLGASRYQPAPSQPSSSAPASGYVDPYTGASRYSGTSQPASPPSITPTPQTLTKILPFSTFVVFKQANVSAMRAKLYQFDDALRSDPSTVSYAIYPDELKLIDEAFTVLSQVTSQPTSQTSVPLGVTHLEAIRSILFRWPMVQRFPVMDLTRLMLAYCADALPPPLGHDIYLESLFKASDWMPAVTSEKPMSKTQETNILLQLRAVANCFHEGAPVNEGKWVKKVFETLALARASNPLPSKAQRVALASILFNFSCIQLKTPVSPAVRDQCLSLILKMLRPKEEDPEVAYRACVALGNLLYAARTQNMLLDPESQQVTELKAVISSVRSSLKDERISNIYKEIVALAP
ncbi:WD40-repeat-containing domain protein [Melanogaster broomeanus]|nr:WD40-repeat-containing domain protein [Melanogaster broomeanus]